MPENPTDCQKAASRANGRKSLGATSNAGRYNSARNNLKHGVLAATLLLPGEDPDDFSVLYHSVANEFEPSTEIERTLVQVMVAAQWRLKRIWSLEQAALLKQSAASVEPSTVTTSEGTWEIPAARNAAAFQSVHTRSGTGSIMQLAESRYQRQLNQALDQFRALRASHPATRKPKKCDSTPRSA